MKATGLARQRSFWIALSLLAYCVFGGVELVRSVYVEPDQYTILAVVPMFLAGPVSVGLFILSFQRARRVRPA